MLLFSFFLKIYQHFFKNLLTKYIVRVIIVTSARGYVKKRLQKLVQFFENRIWNKTGMIFCIRHRYERNINHMVTETRLKLTEIVKSVLDDNDIHYLYDEERSSIFYTMHSRVHIRTLECKVLIKDTTFTVYASFPFRADTNNAEQMSRVAEFICRANYGLKYGNFEFDFRDGEIDFKMTCDCEGDEEDTLSYSKNIINAALHAPITLMYRYAPGLIDVLYKEVAPEDAVKTCEDKDDSNSSSISNRLRSLLDQFLEARANGETNDEKNDEDDEELEEDEEFDFDEEFEEDEDNENED